MGKSGSLMPNNLICDLCSQVFMSYNDKKTSRMFYQSDLRNTEICYEGIKVAKFSRELRLDFTDKCMEK